MSVLDDDSADDDGDVGEGVAEVVDQDAAQIQIRVAAHQGKRDSAIDQQGCDRGPDHPAFNDLHGRTQAFDGFVAQPQGEQDQQNCVGEGGERA